MEEGAVKAEEVGGNGQAGLANASALVVVTEPHMLGAPPAWIPNVPSVERRCFQLARARARSSHLSIKKATLKAVKNAF